MSIEVRTARYIEEQLYNNYPWFRFYANRSSWTYIQEHIIHIITTNYAWHPRFGWVVSDSTLVVACANYFRARYFEILMQDIA